MRFQILALGFWCLCSCQKDPAPQVKTAVLSSAGALPMSSEVQKQVVLGPAESELKGSSDSVMVEILADLDQDGQSEKIQAVQVDRIPYESFHNHLRIFKKQSSEWRLLRADTGILNSMEMWGEDNSYEAGKLFVSKGILKLDFGSRFQQSSFAYRFQKSDFYLIGATTSIAGEAATEKIDVNFSTHQAIHQWLKPRQDPAQILRATKFSAPEINVQILGSANRRIKIWDPQAHDSLSLVDLGEES